MDFFGYIAAILMGVSLGLIGGGGSILTLPILIYLFHQDPLVATTGSLFVVGVTAFAGVISYGRKGLVEFKTGLAFVIPSFAGVVLARKVLLPSIPESVIEIGSLHLTKSLIVLLSFAILMVIVSIIMIRSKTKISDGHHRHSFFQIGLRGVMVGIVTGFVGAGGGFLIIPALVVLLNLPMRNAIGTSLGIITLNSLFGFAISAEKYLLNWQVLFLVSALGVLGLLIGQKLSPIINEKKLKIGFGYFVLTIGVIIFLKVFIN